MEPAATENSFHPNLSDSSPARSPKVTCVHWLFAADCSAPVIPNPTPAAGHEASNPCATVWDDCSLLQDGCLFHVVPVPIAPVSHACTGVAVQDGDCSSSMFNCAERTVDP